MKQSTSMYKPTAKDKNVIAFKADYNDVGEVVSSEDEDNEDSKA